MTCRLWNPTGVSYADAFKALPAPEKASRWASLTKTQRLRLAFDWSWWARPKQVAPLVVPDAPWRYWAVFAGRMFGKTRLAAEWIRGKVERGEARKILLAAPRYQDVEKVMIPALQRAFPASQRPKYVANKLRVTFYPYTADAPYADVCTGEKPDGFRGNEWDCGWIDEFAAIEKLDEVWQLLLPAMRAIPPKGGVPQLVLTTTPRNKQVLHDLLADPAAVLTQGASAENEHNVAGGVLDAVRFVYGGSDLAAQELDGQLLGNEPGAMFRMEWFNANRAARPERLKRLIIMVDTSGSGSDTACECGILLLGLSEDGQTVYVLADYSLRASPADWAKVVMQAAADHHAIVHYEANYGGQLVPDLFKLLGFKAPLRPYYARGTKAERAQPTAALTQNRRVKMVGTFPKLEMQCCTWVPGDRKSPDRLDALADGVSELIPAIHVTRGIIQIPGMG